jgi:hypothetical protein
MFFKILFIISNPFELSLKLNVERLLFVIYNAKAHISTNINMQRHECNQIIISLNK